MQIRVPKTAAFFLVALAAVLLYVHALGQHGIEYRDDEIFYYHGAAEMFQQGNWLTPTYLGAHRFAKPILFYWFVMMAYALTGVSWFSARLVSVLFAGLTVGLTWMTAREMFRTRTAVLSCIILMTLPLFFRHARNAVPDMSLNFFIVLATVAGWKFTRRPDRWFSGAVLFIAAALGFMVKGFTAVLFPILTFTLYALGTGRRDLLARIRFPRGFLIMAAVILPWFLYMVHRFGAPYIRHMVVRETWDRLYDPGVSHVWAELAGTFLKNFLFYTKVLVEYFPPWSFFLVAVLPWTFREISRKREGHEHLIFLVIWLAGVFCFFCLINFRISHYLLALSTPLAILTGYFFCEGPVFDTKISRRTVKGVFIALFVIGILGMSFIFVFLAGVHSLWLTATAAAAGWVIVVISRSRDPFVPPAAFGIFVMAVLFQSSVLADTGVCSLSTYQRLAAIVHRDPDKTAAIAVASHDLHEKEFQIYFDRRIIKTGHGYEPLTHSNLMHFLKDHPQSYCVITRRDYDKYKEELTTFPVAIAAEDYIFRKRLHLDGGFAMALLHLDRPAIRRYLMEKVLLLCEDRDPAP